MNSVQRVTHVQTQSITSSGSFVDASRIVLAHVSFHGLSAPKRTALHPDASALALTHACAHLVLGHRSSDLTRSREYREC
jgi:hypothetical protein